MDKLTGEEDWNTPPKCSRCGMKHWTNHPCPKICFRDNCKYRGSIQCDELCPDSIRQEIKRKVEQWTKNCKTR